MVKITAILCLLLLNERCGAAFNWENDTFSFKNETYLEYEITADGELKKHSRVHEVEYARSCFVLSRAVIQFRRFAYFAPREALLSGVDYRERVRQLARIPAWSRRQERIVFPGYKNLREFSEEHEQMLKQELGKWWPTYLRVGNWRMVFPFPRSGQAKFAQRLADELERGRVQALFLTRFGPINHCIVAYRSEKTPNGGYRFIAYDPNNHEQPVTLKFDPESGSFHLQRTDYFPGGIVNVAEAFTSPWR